MTNYAQQSIPASPEQEDLLGRLSFRCGVSYVPPRSSAHASEQIDSLLARESCSAQEGADELRSIREELALGGGAVALIDDDEIGGHGSTAHWR